MKAGLEHVKPCLLAAHPSRIGKFLIGTVQNDYTILARDVAIMLEGKALRLSISGVRCPTQSIRSASTGRGGWLKWIGMSALLTTTMLL